MVDEQRPTLEVFFSYAHTDDILRQKLENHLSVLRHQKLITDWYPSALSPGKDWRQEINVHLDSADIFLLLVSADFLASDYCYSTELKRAMERHANRTAQVIPIIARPADWSKTPFEYLQVLPRNKLPIMSWPDPDAAFEQVAKEIRAVVEAVAAAPKNKQVTSSLVRHIPYDRNPLFTGRDQLLEELHSAFQAQPAAARTLALSGLGGMGKTQTAIEYAHRYQQDYETILWVGAESEETMLADFFTVAQLLDLPQQTEQDQTLVIEAVKRWLQTHKNWLLIFDNADTLSLLKNVLPTQHQGHILLTTQSQQTGQLARRLPIDKMQPEHALLFLLRRAGCIGPDDDLTKVSASDTHSAQDIVRLLDGLPLALDQAGAYIDEMQCGLDGYLKIFQTQQDYLLQQRGKWVNEHATPVTVTLSLAFDHVIEENPAAADLLRLCAFLDPDAIPEDLIIDSMPVLPASLQRVVKELTTFNETIGVLLQYSLIRRNPNHTLSLHRLVQQVLKNQMDTKTQRRWATRAIQAVNHVYPIADYTNQQVCLAYLPHAQQCALLIDQWNIISPDAANLLNAAGSYLQQAAQYKQVEPLYTRALTINEKALGAEHPETATTLDNLATLYQAQGRYEEAEPLFLRGLAICEKVLGAEHPETATTLNNLAVLYQDQGRYEEAEPLYLRDLSITEKVLGAERPETGVTLDNLARLYQDQGRYQEVEPLILRALAIREKVLGAEHPETGVTLDNLARLYQNQGRYEEAEPLVLRSLAISEKVLGAEHPDTASSLNNLARLYQNQGRYEEAELLYMRALAIYEKSLGAEHPWTTTTLDNLAQLYQAQGRYEEAELLFLRALMIREKALGAEHPETATTLNNLAVLYQDQGRYEEAEPLILRDLAISEKVLGAEHPSTATTLDNLGMLYQDQGRYEEAEPLILRALAIREKVLGAEHPATIVSKQRLQELRQEED